MTKQEFQELTQNIASRFDISSLKILDHILMRQHPFLCAYTLRHTGSHQIGILKDSGVDLIVAETMINIEETLAAVDAASTVCGLPIMCTMTVDADGSIFSGGNAIEAAVSLEAAGADAVGVNCSVGPDQLVSVIRNIKENVSIPVIAKPNAGMPFIDDKGNAVYSMKAPDFARHVKALIDAGASIVGGCCGTTPEYIREVAKMIGR